MLNRVFISIFIAMLGFAATAETETNRAPDMIISSVTLDDMRLLLDDMGARYSAAGVNERGAPFVFAVSQSGMSFGLYSVCADDEGTDCKGIEMLAVFGSNRPAEAVEQLDQAYAAVSVYKPTADTVHVSRYVILDHGVTWANLLENAAVFEALCDRVLSHLSIGPTQPPSDGAQ